MHFARVDVFSIFLSCEIDELLILLTTHPMPYSSFYMADAICYVMLPPNAILICQTSLNVNSLSGTRLISVDVDRHSIHAPDDH